MSYFVLCFIAAYSLEVEKITGTTPPAVPCPDSLCTGRSDGNFEYHFQGEYRANYFLQCSNGFAFCQPCFPLSLEFSEGCNQCLYTKQDKLFDTFFFIFKSLFHDISMETVVNYDK